MDATDQAILRELEKNARIPAAEIGKQVGLSAPAVAERIRKLERSRVILQYTVQTDRCKTGLKLLAFVLVCVDKAERIDGFRNAVIKHPCVLECHHIAGAYDYLLKVAVEDMQALEEFLSGTLKKIKGVSSTNTMLTLMTLKEEVHASGAQR